MGSHSISSFFNASGLGLSKSCVIPEKASCGKGLFSSPPKSPYLRAARTQSAPSSQHGWISRARSREERARTREPPGVCARATHARRAGGGRWPPGRPQKETRTLAHRVAFVTDPLCSGKAHAGTAHTRLRQFCNADRDSVYLHEKARGGA